MTQITKVYLQEQVYLIITETSFDLSVNEVLGNKDRPSTAA